jgi:hypothetical protein
MRQAIDGIDSKQVPKFLITTKEVFAAGEWRDMADPEEVLSLADIL